MSKKTKRTEVKQKALSPEEQKKAAQPIKLDHANAPLLTAKFCEQAVIALFQLNQKLDALIEEVKKRG